MLGPVEVWLGDRKIEVGAAKLRAVLAVLLLHANETVLVDDLIEQVWSGSPPEAARSTVQAYIYRLRRLLQDLGDGILQTNGVGYVLTVPPDALDLHQFDALVAQGRRRLQAGEWEEGSSLLRAALALCSGPALATVPPGTLTAAVQGIEARRLAVTEQYVLAQLSMGRHASVLHELTAAAAANPYSELLQTWCMLALYRCGRRAEALAAYGRMRAVLVADLGIEPGAEMQRMHAAILDGWPAMELPPAVVETAPPRPAEPADESAPAATVQSTSGRRPVAELPPDIAHSARREELATVRRLLLGGKAGRPASICVITGTGGVGKSALAIHSAHALAPHFPDGALYVHLNGWRAAGAPLRPAQVLGRWLRTMGVDAGDVPDDPGEAAALFRSTISGRRMIMVLDNAYDAAQVAPLLPAAGDVAVLVTARRNLGTLDNTTELRLTAMNHEDSLDMIGELVGAARVADEPTVAATVVRRCGYLPLALRVAAARIAGRPDRPISAFARLLADESHRLDELRFGDLDVRGSIQISYDDLLLRRDGPRAAHLFGLLGLPREDELSLGGAAALAGWSAGAADTALEQLVDANLLQCVGASYRIPDLIRLFAREKVLEQESATDREVALRRLNRYALAQNRPVRIVGAADRRGRPVTTVTTVTAVARGEETAVS